jgi:hypothetical protein
MWRPPGTGIGTGDPTHLKIKTDEAATGVAGLNAGLFYLPGSIDRSTIIQFSLMDTGDDALNSYPG